MGTLHVPTTHPYYPDYTRLVKTEDHDSPDLSNLQNYQFRFSCHTPSSHGSVASVSHSRDSSDSQISCPQVYRFGHLPPMSYSDDYDDIHDTTPAVSSFPSTASANHDRLIRKRSSKACDQCRKSKCKCERSGPNEPCKNCIMLGTSCTFLGPSRKRGPPKGYIDAIEARLHQTEALLGVMLATSDNRAQSLLRDIGKDPLAKEIISRVDNSPYGVKGRKREDVALTLGNKGRSGHSSETSQPGQPKSESVPLDITSTHPSNEWQDRVSSMLDSLAGSNSVDNATPSRGNAYSPKCTPAQSSDDNLSPGGRRQRRRVDEDYTFQSNDQPYSNSGPASSSARQAYGSGRPYAPQSSAHAYNPGLNGASASRRATGDKRSSSVDDSMTSDSEEELMGAVGQLSLNEDEQVRYHGKASGLQYLGDKERVDRRNEGGIWRFPKARVWPPLPSRSTALAVDDELVSELPPPDVQQRLLDLYFNYVHTSFPILHKSSFLETYKAGSFEDSPQSSDADNADVSPFNRRRRRVPSLLLFSIFALAARYDETATPLPSDPSMMWEAGDEYLDRAKIILDKNYSSSRPSTVQALLLMGYREVGIGAMAQAWTYIGMAIRMAQDLGMHRNADGWQRTGLGGKLFTDDEVNERKRIWFGCVIMDKYVSTYIGRPLMIFERDFDNTLPNADDSEEFEDWTFPSAQGGTVSRVAGRVISCFNASASLSNILSSIIESIYAVRPTNRRYSESLVLEAQLDKWYLDLPDHLVWDPASPKQTPPMPNVLTLHMQYWCAVLLLHRPFIRHALHGKQKQSDDGDDAEIRATAEKSYDLCIAAANHITSIVSIFRDKYPINCCSVFLTYYVFTASIMHVTNLTAHPTDPQSRLGLSKCMDALRAMEIVWPSAGRALELFQGAKVDSSPDNAISSQSMQATNSGHSERAKRTVDQSLDDSFPTPQQQQQLSPLHFDYIPPLRVPHASPHISTSTSYSASQDSDVYSPQTPYMASGPPSAGPVNHPSASMVSGFSWQGSEMPSHAFNAPLSTAVLPQSYSMGVVDSIHSPQMHGRMHPQPHPQHTHSHPGDDQHAHPTRRYPQYYGYGNPSAYSQMPGSTGAYDIPVADAVQVPQAQGPQPQHQHQPSQMYIPEHYNIYDSQQYSSR